MEILRDLRAVMVAQPLHTLYALKRCITSCEFYLCIKFKLMMIDVCATARRLPGVVPHHLFDFFFCCLPFCSPCSNHAALASRSSSRAQSMITRQDFQFTVCLFGILFPQIATESIFSPSVVCVTFSVKCCLSIWNCVPLPCLQCLFLFPAFLFSIEFITFKCYKT